VEEIVVKLPGLPGSLPALGGTVPRRRPGILEGTVGLELLAELRDRTK